MKTKYSILGILLVSIFSCTKKTYTGELAITNINIIDVTTGDIIESQDVVINADTIAYIIDHGLTNIQATQNIDGTNKYIIPGLWDMHVHNKWSNQDFFPLLLANGITGIREMWGDLQAIERIRNLIESDSIIGPDMVSAGAIIDGDPPDHKGSDIADTPQRGREIVHTQKASGADFIKVYSFLEREVYFAIADECKKQDIPFDGHIPIKISLQEALEAGHRSIEHFYGITEFCSSKYEYLKQVMRGEVKSNILKQYWSKIDLIDSTYDAKREPALFQLAEKYTPWICPTLVAAVGIEREYDPDYPYDQRIDYMPQYAINNWRINPEIKQDSISELNLQSIRNHNQKTKNLLKPLKDHGARYLAGSDYPNAYTYPGFSLHEELQMFVDAGFSPLEALQTATVNPAIFLGMEKETGTIDVGKKANLVLLDANPLEAIQNTTKINGVILRGKFLNGNTLKSEIDAIAAQNRKPKIKDIMLPIILEQGLNAGIEKYNQLKVSDFENYNFDEDQLNSLGYELLNKSHHSESVAIFELNVELHPEYGNGYDSLGDAYLAMGEKEKAKVAWQKAVDLGSLVTNDKLKSLE